MSTYSTFEGGKEVHHGDGRSEPGQWKQKGSKSSRAPPTWSPRSRRRQAIAGDGQGSKQQSLAPRGVRLASKLSSSRESSDEFMSPPTSPEPAVDGDADGAEEWKSPQEIPNSGSPASPGSHRDGVKQRLAYNDYLDAPLLTLVDDPESTKQAPLPRMLVCRVKDHDGAVPEPFKLDEVIAIKVTLYAEGSRTVAEGKINIIKKSHSLDKAHYKILACIIYNLFWPTLFGLCFLPGPVATTLLVAMIAQSWQKIDSVIRKYILEYMPIVSICCFLIIVTCWWLPALMGWESSLLPSLILVAAAGIEVKMGKVRAVWPDLPPPREFEGENRLIYLPRPQYPLTVDYSQARLSEMFALREKLLAKEEEAHWGMKVRGISIGSYWVETILSVLFFQEIYNNRTVRSVMFKFLAYVLPVMFLFQVIDLVGPTISTANERFVLLVKSDLIVRILKRIGLMLGYVVPDFLGTMVGSVSYIFECMWWPIEKINKWLTPFDEAFIYMKAKLEPFKPLIDRSTQLFQTVSNVLAKIITHMTKLINSLKNGDRAWTNFLGNETWEKLKKDPINTSVMLAKDGARNTVSGVKTGWHVAKEAFSPTPELKRRRSRMPSSEASAAAAANTDAIVPGINTTSNPAGGGGGGGDGVDEGIAVPLSKPHFSEGDGSIYSSGNTDLTQRKASQVASVDQDVSDNAGDGSAGADEHSKAE